MIKAFQNAHWQIKCLILMGVVYFLALAWTTAQSYFRLAYTHDLLESPTIIHIPSTETK